MEDVCFKVEYGRATEGGAEHQRLPILETTNMATWYDIEQPTFAR